MYTTMCTYQPLNSLYRCVHLNQIIKFKGCLEAASERTNVPLNSVVLGPCFTTPIFKAANWANVQKQVLIEAKLDVKRLQPEDCKAIRLTVIVLCRGWMTLSLL